MYNARFDLGKQTTTQAYMCVIAICTTSSRTNAKHITHTYTMRTHKQPVTHALCTHMCWRVALKYSVRLVLVVLVFVCCTHAPLECSCSRCTCCTCCTCLCLLYFLYLLYLSLVAVLVVLVVLAVAC